MRDEGLSVEELRKLLSYDPETGVLTWKPRPVEMFRPGKQSAAHNAATWNARYAGKPAFTYKDSGGYLVGNIFNQLYRANRVAYAIFHGRWPSDQADHINGDTSDNRVGNLRDVTNAENGKNQRTPKNNTSGRVGVSWHKRDQKWLANIRVDGRRVYLGLFDDFAAACVAREAAERKFEFHENHGRMVPR